MRLPTTLSLASSDSCGNRSYRARRQLRVPGQAGRSFSSRAAEVERADLDLRQHLLRNVADRERHLGQGLDDGLQEPVGDGADPAKTCASGAAARGRGDAQLSARTRTRRSQTDGGQAAYGP